MKKSILKDVIVFLVMLAVVAIVCCFCPDSIPSQVGHFLRTIQYIPSFSAPCSCVCSRLTFPTLLFWHKQGNILIWQSRGRI